MLSETNEENLASGIHTDEHVRDRNSLFHAQ